MRYVLNKIILAIENGENMDDDLNDAHDFLCAMGLDIDDEYLLKCTDIEQAKYYLTLLK